MDVKAIEHAAFNAWPALQQTTYQGVVLRYTNGYTKRANSANVLDLTALDIEHLVGYIENYFLTKAQPSIIRIPSFTKADGLDSYLASRGYLYKDRSIVLSKVLNAKDLGANQIGITVLDIQQWLDSFCQLSGFAIENHHTHLEMLKRIEGKVMPAVLVCQGHQVACCLGVIHEGFLGIFDLITALEYRGQGHASQLLQAMLAWAVTNDASHTYLQVVANNNAAIRLYKTLGYEPAYEYWYRIKALS